MKNTIEQEIRLLSGEQTSVNRMAVRLAKLEFLVEGLMREIDDLREEVCCD